MYREIQPASWTMLAKAGITMHAWNGKIIWINLSSQSTKEEKLDVQVYKDFIGGKGLGSYLLYRELKPGIDPLSPDNILLFLTGPMQGLNAPNVGRWTLVTKSPLTGLYLDSHCGGALGREIKKAGYDALGIQGKANRPTLLNINDDGIVFENAKKLWGNRVYSSTKQILDGAGKGSSVYVIGPAGERMNRTATGCCEIAHQTGRGGAGAVMGSKNLKAVLAHGTRKIKAADPEKISEINKQVPELWKTHDSGFENYGTPNILETSNSLGQFPTRNWQNGYFEEYEKLLPNIIKEKWYSGAHHSCPHCIMRCTHAYHTKDPENLDVEVESMLEYETLGLMGGNLGISDPQVVLQLNYLSDDFGLDTISTGSIIGFAMEAFEKKILTEEEIGFPLRFGDGEAAIQLLKMIAKQEGIGKILAKGVRAASEDIGKGSESLAVHVKGLEVPAWDPRGRKGMGISYATADVGASHLRGWPATTDPPSESALDMIESMIESRDQKILKDSLIQCHFTFRIPITFQQNIELLNAATGLNYDEESTYMFARRVETLNRMFNIREGITRQDDILPPRFWEPEISGPREGMKAFVDNEDFEKCLDLFYELRRWDNNGVPTMNTMQELNLVPTHFSKPSFSK